MFLLTCLANLATKRIKRQWLYVGFIIAAVCYLILSAIYTSRDNWLISYTLFCGVSFALPQLISRIIARKNINHPVIFLQKAKSSLAVNIVSILFLAYLPWVALTPHTYDLIEQKFVYDEFYIFSSFSFLLFYIPFIILALEMTTRRTAFCDNGLYQNGLILDWADFKSYNWIQDKMFDDPEVLPFLDKSIKIKLSLESNKSLYKKPVQLLIPFDEKNTVENFLSKRVSFKAHAQ